MTSVLSRISKPCRTGADLHHLLGALTLEMGEVLMRLLRYGYVIAPLLGGAWMLIVAVTLSFATGEAFAPDLRGVFDMGRLQDGSWFYDAITSS